MALIPLLVLHVGVRAISSGEQGQIMDLGMRTGTGMDAVKKLAAALSWLVGFIFLVGLIGMPVASIAFALSFGLTQVRLVGRHRLWGLLPGAIMAALIFLVFERLMVIEWPAKIVLGWVGF